MREAMLDVAQDKAEIPSTRVSGKERDKKKDKSKNTEKERKRKDQTAKESRISVIELLSNY